MTETKLQPETPVRSMRLLAGGDPRAMCCWIAEINGSRFLKTCRGTESACWGALCGMQEADPIELQAMGWKVMRFSMKPEETDIRYEPANDESSHAGPVTPGLG